MHDHPDSDVDAPACPAPPGHTSPDCGDHTDALFLAALDDARRVAQERREQAAWYARLIVLTGCFSSIALTLAVCWRLVAR